ncbi:hypothetical protein ACFLVP_00910 [Chloroflexota bacterium]
MKKLISLIKRHPYLAIIVVGAIGEVVALSIIYTTIDAYYRMYAIPIAFITIIVLVIVFLIIIRIVLANRDWRK